MSRFISGGLNDDRPSPETTQNDEAWLAAQRQIDATRLSHPFQPGTGQQDGGKSLYETLQANKGSPPPSCPSPSPVPSPPSS